MGTTPPMPTPALMSPRRRRASDLRQCARCGIVAFGLIVAVRAAPAQSAVVSQPDSGFLVAVIRAIADTVRSNLQIEPRLLLADSSYHHVPPDASRQLMARPSALLQRLLARENIPQGDLLEAPRCPGVMAPQGTGSCPAKVHSVAAFSVPWMATAGRNRVVRVIVMRLGPAGRSSMSFDYIFTRRAGRWELVARRPGVIVE